MVRRLRKRSRMLDRQRAESLVGESVREVGVLMVVFAPLEATFSDVSVAIGPRGGDGFSWASC